MQLTKHHQVNKKQANPFNEYERSDSFLSDVRLFWLLFRHSYARYWSWLNLIVTVLQGGRAETVFPANSISLSATTPFLYFRFTLASWSDVEMAFLEPDLCHDGPQFSKNFT
jgi:hypothetical protein